MVTYSSILAWRIPRTKEPGRLESMGSQRIGHEGVTETHTHISLTCAMKKKQTYRNKEKLLPGPRVGEIGRGW